MVLNKPRDVENGVHAPLRGVGLKVGTPDRFRRPRDVGAHLGLTPRRYQPGETDVQERISRCGDKLARTAFYRSLLIRAAKWSALRAWGMRRQRRQPPHDERSCGFRLKQAGPTSFPWGGWARRDSEAGGRHAPKAAKQIEAPRPPNPLRRRPRADREVKRATHGKGLRQDRQLDPDNPDQVRTLKGRTTPELSRGPGVGRQSAGRGRDPQAPATSSYVTIMWSHLMVDVTDGMLIMQSLYG